MEEDGFTILDISGPDLVARPLGSVLDGDQGTLRPDPEKLWKLIVVFEWMCQGPVNSGKMVEIDWSLHLHCNAEPECSASAAPLVRFRSAEHGAGAYLAELLQRMS